MEEKGTVISDGLKWVLGIILTIVMSMTGYALKRDMDTNKKVVTLQTQVIQAQAELIDIWELVNANTKEKEFWVIKVVEMQGNIDLLQYEIEELKN
jgi:hypothetical protein